jgi:hypothetical protein
LPPDLGAADLDAADLGVKAIGGEIACFTPSASVLTLGRLRGPQSGR